MFPFSFNILSFFCARTLSLSRFVLGTLEDLWSITKPILRELEVFILSANSLCELAQLDGVPSAVSTVDEGDERWLTLMAELRARWGLRRLAVCFKRRNADGVQRRWSAVAAANGVHTTARLPVLHKPKDECGGGSAWAAGFLDALWACGLDASKKGCVVTREHAEHADDDWTTVIYDSTLVQAARHADILAALCQETIGDHSHVSRAELQGLESKYKDREINLCTFMQTEEKLKDTIRLLNRAGVVAILRAQNGNAGVALLLLLL